MTCGGNGPFFFFFFSLRKKNLLFLKTEAQLIYSIVLISGVPHSDSALYMCVYVYSFADSFPL